MWPNDADGNAIRARARPAAGEGRLHDRRPGRLHRRHERLLVADRQVQGGGLRDLQHASRSRRTSPTFWQQAAQQGYKPKIVQIAKTGLFPSQVEALGAIGVNLASGAYWTPDYPYKSSLTDITSQGAGRRLPERGRQAVEPAARPEPRAVRRRRRRAQGRRRPQGQGGRSPKAIGTLAGRDPGRPARSWARGPTPTWWPRRSSAASGSRAGQQVQARLRPRARTRPTRTSRSRRS